jgi:hypothetical protein
LENTRTSAPPASDREPELGVLLLPAHHRRGAVLVQVHVVGVELVVVGGGHQVVERLHPAQVAELDAQQAVDHRVAAGGADGDRVGVELALAGDDQPL